MRLSKEHLIAEWPQIRSVAFSYGVDPYFMAAIRCAEAGGPGREFGVLSVDAPDFKEQLVRAAKTVRNKLSLNAINPFMLTPTALGFRRLRYTPQFISFLARFYCPIGAENDPEGLNQNWPINVEKFYSRFVSEGLDGLGTWTASI